jgi:uncharacterized membrane protein
VPELPVVLLEDVGALCGLVFAFAGVGLAEVTGMAIGLLLAVIFISMARMMAKITVDSHAGTADTAALLDRAEAAVRAEVPEARLIFLEPDVERSGQ